MVHDLGTFATKYGAGSKILAQGCRRTTIARFLFALGTSALILACSPEQSSHSEEPGEVEAMPTLEDTNWQALSIDGVDVIENSAPTMLLKADGQLGGSTGCNNYFGSWAASGTEANFEATGASLRACEPELMEQERRFFQALTAVSTAVAGPDGTLSLLDASSVERISFITLPQESTAADTDEPLDLPSSTSHRFDCGDAGPVEFRFVGPDTMELTVGADTYILQHQRAASGARYAGDGAEFWNKGDAAMLTIGDQRFQCSRRN